MKNKGHYHKKCSRNPSKLAHAATHRVVLHRLDVMMTSCVSTTFITRKPAKWQALEGASNRTVDVRLWHNLFTTSTATEPLAPSEAPTKPDAG